MTTLELVLAKEGFAMSGESGMSMTRHLCGAAVELLIKKGLFSVASAMKLTLPVAR